MLSLLGYIGLSLVDDRTAVPEGVEVQIGR
jgi:hypothetical protein